MNELNEYTRNLNVVKANLRQVLPTTADRLIAEIETYPASVQLQLFEHFVNENRSRFHDLEPMVFNFGVSQKREVKPKPKRAKTVFVKTSSFSRRGIRDMIRRKTKINWATSGSVHYELGRHRKGGK